MAFCRARLGVVHLPGFEEKRSCQKGGQDLIHGWVVRHVYWILSRRSRLDTRGMVCTTGFRRGKLEAYLQRRYLFTPNISSVYVYSHSLSKHTFQHSQLPRSSRPAPNCNQNPCQIIHPSSVHVGETPAKCALLQPANETTPLCTGGSSIRKRMC